MLVWEDLSKKSPRKLKQQIEAGVSCTVEGCNMPLTQKTGPGQDMLCRKHQKNLREFGGTGRLDRPHTHHRKWTCDECGKNIQEEVRKKFPLIEEEDPALFSRMCRNRIIGDHIVRKVDGGPDTEENIQSLCLDCNSDKTILAEDWRNKD
jgi:5-methylcytosine-specific restriction endonuclease McrA|tara:strand:- start:4093 stop:4542 length:450 start_codon:yes stop_codon:yes gene_type:complete